MNRSVFTRACGATLGSLTLPLRAGAQTALPTMRLGVVTSDAYGEAYYGDDAGIFKANGIAVDLKPLANSAAIAAAIVGGSLDAGIGSPSQVAAARENGLPFAFFAPCALFVADAPTTVLMVPKNSPFKTAADLNGKTIATENLKSLPQLSVVEWMLKNGGDPASLKWAEIPTFSMAGALQNARVDAAVIAEPALAASRKENRQLASPFEAIGKSWYLSAWFSTKPWLDANLPLARKFVTAIAQTATWANAHHRETAVTLERVTKIEHDVVGSLTRVRFGVRMDPALMEPILQLAYKDGLLSAPMTAKEMIYPGL
jgi:NitT/TauT family transport system substrate-binding protein